MISFKRAFYIKLGQGGDRAAKCIQDGTVWFGFEMWPHELCLNNDENRLREVSRSVRQQPVSNATVGNDLGEIRRFYGLKQADLLITFHAQKLYYAFVTDQIDDLGGDGKLRYTQNPGWQCLSTKGATLDVNLLSTALTKIQSYQRTICEVGEVGYLQAKINGIELPEVDAAVKARDALEARLVLLIKRLHQNDFEIFIDLVLQKAGLQRINSLGTTQKSTDGIYIEPFRDKRIAMQAKTFCTKADIIEFANFVQENGTFDEAYFATHSDHILPSNVTNITLLNAQELAKKAIRQGLIDWLIERAI